MPDQRPCFVALELPAVLRMAVDLEEVDGMGIEHEQAEMRERRFGVRMFGRKGKHFDRGAARAPAR